jgi:Na+/melibiose symporter-like transporter
MRPSRRWSLGPVRHPAFARLWLAGAVSETGDWLLLIALPVYVLRLTGSALITSTVFLLGLLPGLVVGPLAGVLVDRWDRRRTLVAVSLAQAALLLPLLAVRGHPQLWILYAVTAAEAALGHLFQPAKNAQVPALVPAEELVAANSLTGLTDNLARLVGGPLGGVILELGGLGGIVACDAASFVVAAALLVGGRNPARAAAAPPLVHQAPRPGLGLLGQWVAGLRLIRRDSRLLGALVVTAIASVAQGIFVVLFVVFVIQLLHGGPPEVGLLRGVQAIGALLGGLLLAPLGRRLAPHHLAGAGLLAFGFIELAIWNGPALTTGTGLYVGLFVAVGLPGIALFTGLTAFVQGTTPEGFRGRVFSAWITVSDGFQALGMLLAGVLAGPLGLLPVLNGQAALYLLAGLLAFALLARRAGGRPGPPPPVPAAAAAVPGAPRATEPVRQRA